MLVVIIPIWIIIKLDGITLDIAVRTVVRLVISLIRFFAAVISVVVIGFVVLHIEVCCVTVCEFAGCTLLWSVKVCAAPYIALACGAGSDEQASRWHSRVS